MNVNSCIFLPPAVIHVLLDMSHWLCTWRLFYNLNCLHAKHIRKGSETISAASMRLIRHVGHFKRNNAFERAQNVQILKLLRKNFMKSCGLIQYRIKHGFSCINIRHLPRDLANVYALKNHVRSLLLHKNWKHLLHFALFLALFCFAFSPMSRERNFYWLCSF